MPENGPSPAVKHAPNRKVIYRKRQLDDDLSGWQVAVVAALAPTVGETERLMGAELQLTFLHPEGRQEVGVVVHVDQEEEDIRDRVEDAEALARALDEAVETLASVADQVVASREEMIDDLPPALGILKGNKANPKEN